MRKTQFQILLDYMTHESEVQTLLTQELTNLRFAIELHNATLARIIAKVDPSYGLEMDSPRKAELNAKLTSRVMGQLKAEALVQAHNDPEREAQLKRYFGEI